jgi:hypothetical protein
MKKEALFLMPFCFGKYKVKRRIPVPGYQFPGLEFSDC